jgi:hypothetical protein
MTRPLGSGSENILVNQTVENARLPANDCMHIMELPSVSGPRSRASGERTEVRN